MKLFLLAILMVSATPVWAQKSYTVSTDDKTGQLVFRGPITVADLKNEPKFKWFKESTEGYKPDMNDVKFLTENLPKYKLVIFMGTWCDDSQYLIPKLYYVLGKTSFSIMNLTMYGMDRDKTTGGDEKERYKISKVPTVILFRDNFEAGRITESVAQSVEHDLADLIQQDMAKQNH